MNEIFAPIYYCFFQEKTPFIKQNIEEISFYCFQNVMSSILEHFIKSLDSTNLGILEKIKEFKSLFH